MKFPVVSESTREQIKKQQSVKTQQHIVKLIKWKGKDRVEIISQILPKNHAYHDSGAPLVKKRVDN